MVAFLWRLEGSSEGSAPTGFGDVPDGAFDDAANWLLASDVTTGCTASSYCPQELMTRAKIFMFLRQPEDLG